MSIKILTFENATHFRPTPVLNPSVMVRLQPSHSPPSTVSKNKLTRRIKQFGNIKIQGRCQLQVCSFEEERRKRRRTSFAKVQTSRRCLPWRRHLAAIGGGQIESLTCRWTDRLDVSRRRNRKRRRLSHRRRFRPAAASFILGSLISKNPICLKTGPPENVPNFPFLSLFLGRRFRLKSPVNFTGKWRPSRCCPS